MSRLFIELGFTDKERQLKYSKELLFVSRLYSRFISNIKIENLQKIAIQLIDLPSSAITIQSNKLIKVCLIYKYLDFEVLDNLASDKKRFKFILDFMLEAIIEASRKFNWPVELFQIAYDEVIKTGFNNEYPLTVPKLSRDGRWSALLLVVVNCDYSTIYVELTDRRNKIGIRKIEIVKISFYENNLLNIASGLKWINNNDDILISNSVGEINFKYSIPKNTVEILLKPRKHDEGYLLEELKLLNPNTSNEEYISIIQNRISRLSAL